MLKPLDTLPGLVRGAAWGLAVWCAAAAGAAHLDSVEQFMPRWIQRADLIDIAGTLCTLIAYPISVASFLWIWGDDGPRWTYNRPLNVAAGLTWAIVAGGMAGFALKRACGIRLLVSVICFVVALPLLLLLTLDG